MQIRLSIKNEKDVNSFIRESFKMAPGLTINPTDIVNRILTEGLQKELKRFVAEKVLFGVGVKSSGGLVEGAKKELKRFERKKP